MRVRAPSQSPPQSMRPSSGRSRFRWSSHARALVCRRACENGAVPADDPDGRSFEEVARALADEVQQAVERLSTIDLDDVARAANEEAERARRWIEDLARSVVQSRDTAR